jgi:hypothetical protein
VVGHVDHNRDPHPAGHPDTWGLINKGTVLEGAKYPYPVFTNIPFIARRPAELALAA